MNIKYVSVAEMVQIERDADSNGLPYARMMENAGHGLAQAVNHAYSRVTDRTALGLVGTGNNGGDTLVALAHLATWGWRCTAYMLRARSNDPLVTRLVQAGGTVYVQENDADTRHLAELLESHTVLLDGILGTGFRLPLKPELGQLLEFVKKKAAALPNLHVVAVDCPSGINCDTGAAAPETLPAERTISMAAAKQGLMMFPAYNLVGKLQFVGIGIGEEIIAPQSWERIKRFVVDAAWVRSVLPDRPLDAHKGTFGTALVVAGCSNYSGAVLLAGRSAYCVGAGLVTLAVPMSLHSGLAGQLLEATWLPLPDAQGFITPEAAGLVQLSYEHATAMLIGPGLGVDQSTQGFIGRLFDGRQVDTLPPLVLDADGLKLVSRLSDWPTSWPFRLPPLSVLTPHPGEMSVLTRLSKDEIQSNRLESAERYAVSWGHIVVLKGAFTIIAAPDGQTGIIPVASPALARAGSGDVLAGLLVGLRAQGLPAFEAACAAAWIHAQAGLLAADKLGSTTAILAGDILAQVPAILSRLENGPPL